MEQEMEPLPITQQMFTLEDVLDDKWTVLAKTIVKEPSDTEESDAKVKEFKDQLKEKFPDVDTEEILADKNNIKFLRSTNWNVAEAVEMFLTSVQQYKNFLPFITAGSPSQLERVWTKNIVSINSRRDQWGRRVILFRLGKWNPDDFPVQELYTATFSLLQMISLEAVTQVAGTVFVADLQGFGFKHLKSLGVGELKCLGSVLSGGFPMWFRKLHFVNNPRLFNMLYSILKGFLGPRIRDNVLFHGYNVSGLLDYLPAEVLPEDLGGHSDEEDGKLSIDILKKNEALVLSFMEQFKSLSKH